MKTVGGSVLALALATGASVLAMGGSTYAQEIQIPGVCLTDQRGTDRRCECFDEEGDLQPGRILGADGFCRIIGDRDNSPQGAASFDAGAVEVGPAPEITSAPDLSPDQSTNRDDDTVVEDDDNGTTVVEDDGKANNGWGNEGDPTNPGSDDGNQAQSETKSDSDLR